MAGLKLSHTRALTFGTTRSGQFDGLRYRVFVESINDRFLLTLRCHQIFKTYCYAIANGEPSSWGPANLAAKPKLLAASPLAET